MEKEQKKQEREKEKIRKKIHQICRDDKKKIKQKILWKKNIIETIGILLGSFIMAVGTSQFLLPNQLSSGGFSGLATIVYYFLHFPVGTFMLALNIPLLFFSLFRIGKEFLVKSIEGTIFLALFIDIMDQAQPLTNDKFLACIYGGIAMGIGTAIILKYGASTGGTDLLTYLIRSYKPNYQASNLIVLIDSVIIAINVVFFKEIEVGLYSAITIYIMGKMIDIVFEGVNFTKVLYIISPQYEKIAKIIGEHINRGSTGIYAKGMYTNQEKMMLICVGSRREVYQMKHITTQIDQHAFMIIMNAREVWGRGFKKEGSI